MLPSRVYSKLKYESGVHRVQRVPATETSGRVHTSTATVAIMPEVDDVDVKIDPKVRMWVCVRKGGREREAEQGQHPGGDVVSVRVCVLLDVKRSSSSRGGALSARATLRWLRLFPAG
jgi:hypothetical protein